MNIHYTYKGNKRLAVVTFPFEETKGSHILLENFLRIVEPQSQIIYVITGGYPQESVFPKKITVKNHVDIILWRLLCKKSDIK